MKTSYLAGALALVLLASASDARACAYGCDGAGLALIPLGITAGVLAGLATVGVLGMDLTYLMRNEAQPTDFAIANLVLGLVDIGGGIALAFGGSDTFVGFGLGFVGAGTVLLIDGIVALAMGPPDPSRPRMGLAVSISPDGATLGWSDRF